MKYIDRPFRVEWWISTEYDCHLNVSTSHFVGCEGSDGGSGKALGGCEESGGVRRRN